jgi:hypothetical protein
MLDIPRDRFNAFTDCVRPVAPSKAANRQHHALAQSKPANRFLGISGASWLKVAVNAKPPGATACSTVEPNGLQC